MGIGKEQSSGTTARSWLVVLGILVLCVVANNVFQAHERASASQLLLHSSITERALSHLQHQVTALRQEVAAAHHTLRSSSNHSDIQQLQQQVQQLQGQMASGLQPLQETSKVAASVLEQVTMLEDSLSLAAFRQQVETSKGSAKVLVPSMTPVPSAAAVPSASSAPAAASIHDNELHHILQHTAVCEKHNASGLTLNITANLVAPLVVVAHARAGYLARTMTTLLKHWSADPENASKFPLFISVDGDDQRTLMLAVAMSQATGAQVIARRRSGGPLCRIPDCHISQHYKLLLELFLHCHEAPGVLFLEEDLEIAPDFLSYFDATSRLMAKDPSILCVSAWNDHGQEGRAANRTALYRTDVMPGLGWYVNSAVGLELLLRWPLTNWDDWMRLARIREGRSCIFPEIPRTHTFGRKGAHMGEGYDKHLSLMVLNSEPIDWQQCNLSYLLQEQYAPLMQQWLSNAQPFEGSLAELEQYCNVSNQGPREEKPEPAGDLLLHYPSTAAGWTNTTLALKPMMTDMREGSPRGSYKGTVMVRCRGRRLFLTPEPEAMAAAAAPPRPAGRVFIISERNASAVTVVAA